MDLSTFTVVLVFARKFLALQSFQDLTNVLRGLCQHRLDWNAQCQVNMLWQVPNAFFQRNWNDFLPIRQAAEEETRVRNDFLLWKDVCLTYLYAP